MHFGKKLYAGRAAVCTQNTQEHIKDAVVAAYTQFLALNKIHEKNIVSLQYSVTSDITAANPATLLRSAGFASETVLFCSAEPNIDNSPHGIITEERNRYRSIWAERKNFGRICLIVQCNFFPFKGILFL